MRIEKFHYYLLDQYDQPKSTGIGDTNELFNVISGELNYTSLGRLKSSITIKIVDSKYLNIDYLNDRIKLEIEIDGIKYNKGIYLISTTGSETRNGVKTRQLTCYSKLKILDKAKVLSPYYLPAGANIYNAIVNLLGSNPHNITHTDKTLNTSYTANRGTAKLDIINELFDILNYNSLTVDDSGVFTSSPYILPENRKTEIYYIEGDPKRTDASNVCRLISPDIEEELDAFDIPNIFMKHTNDVNIDPPIVAVYPLQSDLDNPITIDGRDPNPNIEEVSDVADYATLYAKCKRDAAEARSIYSHLQIETAISPNHGYLNCIEVKVGDIDNKYTETSWSINLVAGALMKHTLRRVVNLDE